MKINLKKKGQGDEKEAFKKTIFTLKRILNTHHIITMYWTYGQNSTVTLHTFVKK